MAIVELSRVALENLGGLIHSHSLPADTRERLRASLRPLATFPRIGPAFDDEWSDLRFVLGPWRWMVIVYEYLPEEDRVIVVTIQDGRSSRLAG